MISIKSLPNHLTLRNPAALIATGFGSGLIHPAPGTWGTLAAWILGLMVMSQGKVILLLALLAAVIAGLWAIEKFQAASGEHDSGMIVIDEWAGIWLAMLLIAPFWDQIILVFVLFRIFDIWKPWPIGWMDKNIKGAWGVMADDLAAGALAGAIVYGYGLWTVSF